MSPVSYVSCVFWMYSVYAAETHETNYQESGMRYQFRPLRPEPRSDWAFICLRRVGEPSLEPLLPDVRGAGPAPRPRNASSSAIALVWSVGSARL
jgi:hypothetical protein